MVKGCRKISSSVVAGAFWAAGLCARLRRLWLIKGPLQWGESSGGTRFWSRFCWVVIFLLCVALSSTPTARADQFPSKPIRVYVGFSAGGGADIIARGISDVAEAYLGQPMIVVNKPGASGTLAAREVASAEPDGYTLLIAGGSETSCVGHFRKLSYHPIEAFAPIMRVATLGLIITVSAASPWETLDDFVQDARSRPGRYIYASAGYGSLAHATMLLLGADAGILMKHLPFKGGAGGLVALRGGHVDITVAAENEIQALAEALQIRSLAVAGSEGSPILPDVPTLAELGYTVRLANQKGFVAPAGTPKERIRFLHDALKKAFDHPDFVARCERLKIRRAYLNPEEFGESLWKIYRQVGSVVKKR